MTVLAFLLAVFPIIATPGVSFTLMTQRVATQGRRAGVAVAGGTVTGLLVHAGLAIVGLSALVMRSATAFTVVRIAGAAYLVVLGLMTLWSARRTAPTARRLPWTGHGPYVQALLGNVLNPKAASVYLSLVPQFVDPHRPIAGQIAVLAVAHAALAAGWLCLWTVVVDSARRFFVSTRVRAALSRVTGVTLVALGVRTAVSAR